MRRLPGVRVVARRISNKLPTMTPIVIRLFNLGFDGYVTKQAIEADLADLVEETLQG